MRGLKYFLGVVLALGIVAGGTWFWVLHTTSGARWILAQVYTAIGLNTNSVDGDISSGLRVHGISFVNDSVEVTVEELSATFDVDLLPASVDIVVATAREVDVLLLQQEASGAAEAAIGDVLNGLALPILLRVSDLRADDISIRSADDSIQVQTLALVAQWHEDIVIEQLDVSSADLDAVLNAEISLQDPHRMNVALRADLAPDFSRMPESLRLSGTGSGDLNGMEFDLDVGSFAVIDGDINWHDELVAVADITLQGLDLNPLVDAWPAGFPINGEIHATLNDAQLGVSNSELRIGGTDGRILLDAKLDRASYDVAGQLRWQSLRWPLPADEARIRSGDGDMQVAGTVDAWKVRGKVAVGTDEVPDGRFQIDGGGTRDGVNVRLVNGELFGGNAAGMVEYSWIDERPWAAGLDVVAIELDALIPDWPGPVSGHFEGAGTSSPFTLVAKFTDVSGQEIGGTVAGSVAYSLLDERPWSAVLDVEAIELGALLPDWPGQVSGHVEGEGTSSPFTLVAKLTDINGRVRDQALAANGSIEFRDQMFIADNLYVEHGSSRVALDGSLTQDSGMSFDASVAEAGTYLQDASGSLEARGRLSMTDTQPLLSLSLESGEFKYAGIVLKDLRIRDELRDGDIAHVLLTASQIEIGERVLVDPMLRTIVTDSQQSIEMAAKHLGVDISLGLAGAFDDWRRPMESTWHGNVEAFGIDLNDHHSMTLMSGSPLELSLGQIALKEFCIGDQTGAVMCADANWVEDEDVSVSLELTSVPANILEHVIEPGVKFDQHISGTLKWHQNSISGMGGEGNLRIEPGVVRSINDKTLFINTGEGLLSFDVDNGELLSGNLELPLPGTGNISGRFTLLDIVAGADSGVTGNVSVDVADIAMMSELTRLVDDASGRVRATGTLAGTIRAPLVSGDIRLENASISYLPIGLQLTELDLVGHLDPDYSFDLSGTFRAGEGRGEISSRVKYGDSEAPGLHFKLLGDNLTLIDVPDVLVKASSNVDIGFDGETLSIGGSLTIPEALIKPTNLSMARIDESGDVVIVAGELPDPPEEDTGRNGLRYEGSLDVRLGDSVVISLDLAQATAKGGAIFTWHGDKLPTAKGRYDIEGSIAAFGQVLEITEGAIRFPDAPADNPFVRIRAEREIYGNTQVKRAGVLVDGSVKKLTVEPYTMPMTTEERALTLLVTGSDFDYEQGVGAIDFGTYIAPRLFISYGIGVFERENIISARFDLSKKFGIKASSGSKESGVDLNYRFEN